MTLTLSSLARHVGWKRAGITVGKKRGKSCDDADTTAIGWMRRPSRVNGSMVTAFR
jgi:hypothetical protein